MTELDDLKAQLKKTFNDSTKAKNWVTETKKATVNFVNERLNSNPKDPEYIWMSSELDNPLSTQGLPDRTETAIKDCVSLLACAYKDVLLSYFPRKSIISRVKDALFYIIKENWCHAMSKGHADLLIPGGAGRCYKDEDEEVKEFLKKAFLIVKNMVKSNPGNLKNSLNQIKKPTTPEGTGASLNKAMTDWWDKMLDEWLAKVGKLDKNHINFGWDSRPDAAYWAKTVPPTTTTVGWAIHDDFV